MIFSSEFKDKSFLIYGLGLTGQSVVKFFKKNNIKRFKVWDDKNKKIYLKKRSNNLKKTLQKVDYIILSPGVSLSNPKNNILKLFKKKIITDIDLLFLSNNNFKSILITGTNGKSTTCKLIYHLLKKNNFNALLGGNIGTPVLDLKIKRKSYVVIEASSFQLSHSKFIAPDYAIFLNISNDHLDWHGSFKNYVQSKLKIFNLQSNAQFAIINSKISKKYNKNNFLAKTISPNIFKYEKIKNKIKNSYLNLNINDENMSFVFSFSKLLKIKENSFINSMKTFKGLPHRYEIFLKKKNITFINDSKATSFQATKSALENSKNIFWILGGLPKKKDKIILKNLKNNIFKAYIIGKNINFFKKQIKNQLNFSTTINLKSSVKEIIKDIKSYKKKNNTILLSPAAASYDQFSNFEKRGNEFKKLCNYYGRK